MTLKRFGLDYAKCTLEELRGFMAARGIKFKKGQVACVAALQSADRDITFRFQDLPGELRNRIYFELLTLRDADSGATSSTPDPELRKQIRCHPQILAACSSIRNEASSILYGVNEFTVSLHRLISSYPDTRGNICLYFSTQPLSENLEYDDHRGLYAHHHDWSSALLLFEKMHIRISSVTTNSRFMNKSEWAEDCQSLQSFVAFIQHSKALKIVRITGDRSEGSESAQERSLLMQLYPLSRLCANQKCEFEGFDEYPNMIETIRRIAEQNSDIYQVNLEKKAILVRQESDAYKELSELTSDRSNKQRHMKLCRNVKRVFGLALNNPENERELLQWVNEMAQFLNRAYESEAREAMTTASGFWLDLVKVFDEAHKKRVEEFPE